MAQNLHIDQIGNLSITATDSKGNPVVPAYDAPPTWTLTDSASSGATLVASADGTTAVLTPEAVNDNVTINLAASVGGVSFQATLAVTFVSGSVASISIVMTPVPAPTPTPAPAPSPAPAPATP